MAVHCRVDNGRCIHREQFKRMIGNVQKRTTPPQPVQAKFATTSGVTAMVPAI